MAENTILINEIIKYTDHTARILITLATVGIASDGQLARLCLNLSGAEGYFLKISKQMDEKYKEVLKEAERIVRTEGYVEKEAGVQLPKYMGGGQTNAWYLTRKGVAAVKIINPYFARYAVEGLPCGSKTDRIPHELAVTESFLKLVERQTVCDFIPERELKRRLMKRRHELLRQGINPKFHRETMSEETGDFRAVLLPKDNPQAARFEIEGEAAINYRRAQIEAKPDKMVWFVTSTTQKEMVLATKKERLKTVWILGNVCEPLKPEMPEAEIKKVKTDFISRNKLEKKLADYLRANRKSYTGRALACILKESTGSHVSEMLKRLEAKGLVASEEVKLTPARGRGRPNKLFWHTKNEYEIEKNRTDRVKSLVLSETIVFFCERGYRFVQYTEMTGQASFLPLDASKLSPVKVLIESPDSAKEELGKKIEAENFGTQKQKNNVIVAVSTAERYEEIKDICDENSVLLIENKSLYRPEKAVAV